MDYLKKHPLSFFLRLAVWASALLTAGVVIFLIGYILVQGVPNLTLPGLFAWEFSAENQSMMPAIINTVIMTVLTLLLAVPVGVFAAIYLVEYSKKGNRLVKLIRVTAETLSGIPSIVYGLFGYIVFVITLGWSYTLLSGVITLAIMILPLIIRTTEEALMAVPDSFREGSFGLGAGKLRTVFRIVLPSAVPGVLSGIILAIGRIVGESAALIFTAGTNPAIPGSLFSSASTLSVHLYTLLTEGLYTQQAYATAVVLLVMVIFINALSGMLAKKLWR
ncbi:MAG: phosphate ABC transporter permease PstA [Firmicutes bacterium]|nr:phosphate ABC transporter permease PstA [Bacillota bacterium]MBR6585388.1 phosphate ABC transporter permease PstA [Bacillota bacterium]